MKTLFNTIYMSVNSHLKSSVRSAQGLLQNLGLVMVALLFGSLQVWGADIYSETFGTPTGNTNVTDYKGWSATGVKYGGSAKVGVTAANKCGLSGSSGSGYVYMSSASIKQLDISGISTSGYTSINLSYNYKGGSTSAKYTIQYSTDDGNTYTDLSTNNSCKTTWQSKTESTSLPATSKLRLRIINTATNYAVYFDDLKITGTSSGPTLYTVTFDANGGSVTPASDTQASAGAAISLPTPTRDGYNCTGWYTATSGGTKRGDAGGSYTPTASETIYAQWSAKTYTNYRTLCTTTNPSLSVSPTSLTGLDYIVGSGPSASQSFTVSGSNLGADLVVTAPENYEVCKTADGTYTRTIRYTPSDGAVANTTAYVRLAAGLNVGTYNYAAASGLQVTSTGAKTRTAALNGSVTKADCAITFTDFNAVDHYEATLEYGSRVTVSYNYTYNGDGNFSISHSPATGTIDKANKTLTVSTAGIWTLNASATAGTNYSKPSDASAQIRVKCVDTYKDFIHNKTIKAYGSGTAVTDGKMEDWGSGYTVPYIDDNAEETSGSCQQTHYKFMGWVSEDDINIADGTFKTGWTLIQAGTESKLATTKTYYAVWAKLEE